jgi:hypothetical protein
VGGRALIIQRLFEFPPFLFSLCVGPEQKRWPRLPGKLTESTQKKLISSKLQHNFHSTELLKADSRLSRSSVVTPMVENEGKMGNTAGNNLQKSKSQILIGIFVALNFRLQIL